MKGVSISQYALPIGLVETKIGSCTDGIEEVKTDLQGEEKERRKRVTHRNLADRVVLVFGSCHGRSCEDWFAGTARVKGGKGKLAHMFVSLELLL